MWIPITDRFLTLTHVWLSPFRHHWTSKVTLLPLLHSYSCMTFSSIFALATATHSLVGLCMDYALKLLERVRKKSTKLFLFFYGLRKPKCKCALCKYSHFTWWHHWHSQLRSAINSQPEKPCHALVHREDKRAMRGWLSVTVQSQDSQREGFAPFLWWYVRCRVDRAIPVLYSPPSILTLKSMNVAHDGFKMWQYTSSQCIKLTNWSRFQRKKNGI